MIFYECMKKIFFILFIFLFISFDVFAFKYAGVGVGPGFGIKGFGGTKYFINADWQPHDNIGTRLIIGFPDGFWLGVGLNFSYTTPESFSRTFRWTFNGGLPIIMNIHESYQVAFFGVNLGTTLSFDTDGRGLYYIYITPMEIFYSPVTWRLAPNSGWDMTSNMSLITAVGFRAAI